MANTKGKTTESIIQSSLDDIDKFVQSCNIYELSREVNHVSGYLAYQQGRGILTEKEFYKYKTDLSEKIKKTRDHCECNIKST